MAKRFQVDTGGTLTTSLVSYWELEGNSNDFFGANNGTDTSITYATGNGKVNQGAGFSSGSSSLISFPSAAANFDRTNSFSIAFWVKTSMTSNCNLFCKLDPANSYCGINLWLNIAGSSGDLRFDLENSNGANELEVAVSSSSLNNGSWHYVIVTYAGTALPSGVQIFIDGVSQTLSTVKNSLTGSILSTVPFTIGGNLAYLNGDMDEVGVWGKVLSSQEITDLYNGGSGQTMISSTPYTKSMSDSILNGASRLASASRLGTFARTLSASIMNGASRSSLVGKGVVRSMSDSMMNAVSRLSSLISGKGYVATITTSIMNGASRFASTNGVKGFIRSTSSSIMYGASRIVSLVGSRVVLIYMSDTMAAARGRLDGIKAYVNGLNITFKEKYTTQGTVYEDKYQ